jgi:small GTP-binding protein
VLRWREAGESFRVFNSGVSLLHWPTMLRRVVVPAVRRQYVRSSTVVALPSAICPHTSKQQHVTTPTRIIAHRLYSAAPEFKSQYRLLTEEESIISDEQRALMERAKAIASQVQGVQVKTDTLLEDILAGEDQSTFSIVVAGEFNAGKSTLINSLVSTKLLETGALPTTDSIIVIQHGDSNSTHTVQGHADIIIHQVANVPLLQDLTLVDTPGTNAVVLNHTARTMKLLPSADLILFVTSADRPFTESERQLLKSIQAYRKHIVIIVNKMDVLDASGGNYGEFEKQKVVEFVSDNASELLGARPIVIAISARDALSAKLIDNNKNQDSGIWKRSNFAALETFLKETLTEETKIKAKLSSPLGLVDGMMAECLTILEKERQELGVDIATLNLLKTQFKAWEKEMNAELESFRRDVASRLSGEGARAEKLRKRMSLLDWYMLAFDDSRFSSEWKRSRIIGPDTGKGIEEELLNLVRETSESLAESATAQGQAVIEYLGKRPAVKNQSFVGTVTAASKFDESKDRLLHNMSDSIRGVLSEYNAETEKDNLIRSLKQPVVLSSVFQLGAIGAALATATSAVSIGPGIAATVALATSGVAVMSQGTKSVSRQYQEMWKERESELDEILKQVCSKELERGVSSRILAGVQPYTRYVETEAERIAHSTEECESVRVSAQALRNRISKLHR